MFDPGVKLTYEQEQELTAQVRAACEGRWDLVLPRVIPEIQEAIDAGHRRHVTCIFPDHGSEDKFRITNRFADTGAVICTCTADKRVRGGIELIMRARCVDFKTARNLLVEALGIRVTRGTFTPPPKLPPVVRREVDPAEVKEKAKKVKEQIAKIWNETIALTDPAAEAAQLWFENRGVTPIKTPFADIRFHHGLRYYHGEQYIGTFPCIVSMLRDNAGRTRTLHRTYITHDGKKPTEIPDGKTRKLFTVPDDLTATGSAIRIDEPTNCLMLAEGIETALSARRLTRLPTWACVSKDLLRNVELPQSVRIVTVWADKDRSDTGQKAAAELVLALRERGIKAVAMLPPGDIPAGQKSLDWNDLLRQQGVDQLSRDFQFRQWQKAITNLLGNTAAVTGVTARAFD